MSAEKILETLAAFDTNGEAQLDVQAMNGAVASVASSSVFAMDPLLPQAVVSALESTQPAVTAIEPAQLSAPLAAVPQVGPLPEEPLPQLGVEPALQEQLLNAIPPPSTTNVRPTPTSTLPGEFPLSLPPVKNQDEYRETDTAAIPIDNIEATISINIPIPETNSNAMSADAVPTIDTTAGITTTGVLSAAQNQISPDTVVPLPQVQATACEVPSVPSVVIQPALNGLGSLIHQQMTQQTPDQTVQESQIAVENVNAHGSTAQLTPPIHPPVILQSQASVDDSITVPSVAPNHQETGTVPLPPPPPLQPVQAVPGPNMAGDPLSAESALISLVNVPVEMEGSTAQPPLSVAAQPPLSVVVKTEPMNDVSPDDGRVTSNLKINDTNNNPISAIEAQQESAQRVNCGDTVISVNSSGFPVCVISTNATPTNSVSVSGGVSSIGLPNPNPTKITPHFTLPPKKAKLDFRTSLSSSTASLAHLSQPSVDHHHQSHDGTPSPTHLPLGLTSHNVPSCPGGLGYDLPTVVTSELPHSFRAAHGSRLQAGKLVSPQNCIERESLALDLLKAIARILHTVTFNVERALLLLALNGGVLLLICWLLVGDLLSTFGLARS